ncbi:gliding motility-associated C-terminal domain-containing protein [Taibaiella helva]|uniref:gliding motility-associated C-terminal domain-containing protein n=1 Tax=Taibaiella helva TaxID=2301235 RepID=UPI000E58B2AF|nr:gliding motility-associated C-terminal domain-containing protein [Taibaiella helva]
MTRYLLCIAAVAFCALNVSGQGENNNWVFGYHSRLNFNTPTPVLSSANLITQEGCAAVSDASGELLFYSNGNSIWDATGAVMPNGTGILGNGAGFYGPGSTTQGVAIVQSTEDAARYFLFTLDCNEDVIYNNSPAYLRYSAIDMTLNSGRGDVVPGQKNIVLDTFVTEKMVVVRGTACNYWLVTHRRKSNQYRTFSIRGSVDPVPVISTGLYLGGSGAGEMKVSPNRKMIAFVTDTIPNIIEVASFDATTGTVSGAQALGPAFTPGSIYNVLSRYALEFSPDNSKLYCSEWVRMVQYDLTAFPAMPAVAATRTIIAPEEPLAPPLGFPVRGLIFGMRMGPDNKIYVARTNWYGVTIPAHIARINMPNNTGLACGFDSLAITVPAAQVYTGLGLYGFGFGSAVVIADMPAVVHTTARDTAICAGDSVRVAGHPGCTRYLWSDGSTDALLTLRDDGRYWVSGVKDCDVYLDTFRVSFLKLDTRLGGDTFICKGSAGMLLYAGSPGANYRWQDGSTGETYRADTSGTYYVTISNNSCRLTDTIHIAEVDPYLKLSGDDSLICDGGRVILRAASFPPGAYLWNTGSNTDTLVVSRSGSYSVSVVNACGTFSASLGVASEDCDCPVFIPNAFSPNGDGVNEWFRPRINCRLSFYSLSIYNRYGQRVFYSNDSDNGWEGRFRGVPSELGTYFYYLKYQGLRSRKNIVRKGDLTLLR